MSPVLSRLAWRCPALDGLKVLNAFFPGYSLWMPFFTRHRLFVAILAAAIMRYPVWLFITSAALLRETAISKDNYAFVCNWDCGFYSELAANLKPSAFFPLFPLLGSFLMKLFGLSNALSVISLSNLATVIAGVLALYLGESIAGADKTFWGFKYRSWMFLAATSFFPNSHFWVKGYPEPLFFCFFVAGVYAISKARYSLAAISIGLAAVTRPQGIWLMGIFVGCILCGALLTFAKNPKLEFFNGRLKVRNAILAAILAVIPFGLFLYWNWMTQNNALFFLAGQKAWGREFSLITGLKSNIPRFDDSHVYLYASLAAAFVYLRRGFQSQQILWIFLGLITLCMAELPLFVGGFYSYSRFMSVNLGLLWFIVELCANRSPLFMVWLIWSVSRLSTETQTISFGGWAG